MPSNYEKLLDLFRELFQMDQADLDFGIYRIMNAKRDEIEAYLTGELLPQVREILFSTIDTKGKEDLEEAIKHAKELGVDPDKVPRVMELRAKYGDTADITSLENEVFSHLYAFFRRYYKEGDFISQRRYKKDVYAIPYEGEEVKLYWANHDQYYIKTAENFQDYSFMLDSGRKVHFKLVEASTEQDNRKSTNGNERRFMIKDLDAIAEENGELIIRFEYRPDEEKRKQESLNAQAVKKVFSATSFMDWLGELQKKAPTPSNADRTILEKHLATYTAKNSFDYFIHKDLGGFLKRELDFYIKNEIMQLDDVENETAPRVEQYLATIKAIRRIAHKVIRFLAQIEEFQKKLWLKKKFVVETNYCVTLDRIPESLWAEIASNHAQIAEWKRLFQIQNVEGDLVQLPFSEPVAIEFMKQHLFLVVDTRYFDSVFKRRLLASLNDIDDVSGGLLVNSENAQALLTLANRFRESIACSYIDPPYNTGSDEFLYKDSYQKSSWMAMLADRSRLCAGMLKPNGMYCIQIGDDEAASSRLALDTIFAERKNTIVVRRGVKNVQAQFKDIDRLSLGHDVIHVYTKNANVRLNHLRHQLGDEKPGKWDTFWRGTDRATMRYELFEQTPETGQWRWEKNRAEKAKSNYENYLEKEQKSKILDEWYVENLQAGIDLDFVRLNEEKVVQYYVPPQNYRLVSDNWLDVTATGNKTDFEHEKSVAMLQRVVSWDTQAGDTVLDFFAGSGSTAEACIRFGQGQQDARKYVCVEMAFHFDATLLPRVKKAIYAGDYRREQPANRNSGVSHILKYIRLESYEDALNNLNINRSDDQQKSLDLFNKSAKEDYLLSYMLDIETRDSASLLNVTQFKDPFNYKLKITRNNETKETAVDLVETFNYLIGLHVRHIDHIRGIRVVEGTNREHERVLVLWRNTEETDNEKLDAWFNKQGYNTRDQEYDIVYVNGDNNLENLRRPDQTWKVRMIEPEFKKLMFDVKDV